MVITFLASFLIWFMFFGLIPLYFYDGKIKKEEVIHALIAASLAWLITEIIKRSFPTVRPYEAQNLQALTFTVPKDGSFPSGHEAEAFALAITILLHDKKIGMIYLIAALVVGVARIMSNVHYPVDIVGGIVVGGLVAVAIDKLHLFDLLKNHRK